MPRTITNRHSRFPSFQPTSRAAWRRWLQKHHQTSDGVWLVYAKKHSGIASLTYGDAVEEALCFGWIDSLINPIDDRFYRQVFTPRKAKSRWSALNKRRVAKLMEAGLMTPAGVAMVELAKKSGTWEALDHVEALRMPPDLHKALTANAAARRGFAAYPPSVQKQCFYRLHDAKRPETRARRLAEIVAAAAEGRNLFRPDAMPTAARTRARGSATRPR